MDNITQKLNGLQQTLDNLKVQHTRAETQLQSLTTERDQVVSQLKELGVESPSDIEQVENSLQQQISAFEAEIETIIQQLPEEIQNAVRSTGSI